LLIGLVSLAATAGLGLVAAPAASAAAQGAYGCAGSEIDTYNIKDTDGSVWGTLHLFYSSANGGTNCVVNVARKYYGQKQLLEVSIRQGDRFKKQEDYFYEYAGPVSLNQHGRTLRHRQRLGDISQRVQGGRRPVGGRPLRLTVIKRF
jgi:hypothetical protein